MSTALTAQEGGEGIRTHWNFETPITPIVAARRGYAPVPAKQNRAAPNLRPAKAAATPPTTYPTYTRFSTTKYYEHPVLEMKNFTLLVAMKCVATDLSAGDRPGTCGWYIPNAGGSGAGIAVASTTGMRATAFYGGVIKNASIADYTAGDLNLWRLLAMRVEEGVGHTLYDLTRGPEGTVSASVADINARTLNAAGTLYRPCQYHNVQIGEVDIAVDLLAELMSLEYIVAVGKEIRKALLDERGIVV